ncbi:unnamed protein product [Prorocentrum cordatum]|uniref:Very-long-chain (3R)-3-hydroxyacyl-CoA dehydratase n=1 Tax=Prorocentrum cordatum TaxID=2364126 RepID=A0ABN9SHN9_9DINO|nr:unnamed protein product [Polarella glacialis]
MEEHAARGGLAGRPLLRPRGRPCGRPGAPRPVPRRGRGASARRLGRGGGRAAGRGSAPARRRPPYRAPQSFAFAPEAAALGRCAGGFPGAGAYTLRLIVVPMGVILSTGAMTVANTVQSLEVRPVCLFFSDVLNDPITEPWAVWALRWLIWILGISSWISFKRAHMPRQVQWVFMQQWACFMVAILAGFRQLDPPMEVYALMYKLHQVSALIMFLGLWLETVMLWCPSRILHVVYFVTVPIEVLAFAFSGRFYIETGIPYIYGHPEIVLEWLLIFAHFVVVWLRFPAVSAAVGDDGTWRPWVCCFADCCPDLVTHQDQNSASAPARLRGLSGAPASSRCPRTASTKRSAKGPAGARAAAGAVLGLTGVRRRCCAPGGAARRARRGHRHQLEEEEAENLEKPPCRFWSRRPMSRHVLTLHCKPSLLFFSMGGSRRGSFRARRRPPRGLGQAFGGARARQASERALRARPPGQGARGKLHFR